MNLEIKNLSHTYMPGTAFSLLAVKNVNLTIKSGEFIGLIGHSGSGKSTLIQHLNGLLKATEGEILLDNKNIFEDKKLLRDLRFKVGLVFQYPESQLFEETVYADIAYGPKNMGLTKEEIDERVKEAIELSGVKEDYLDKSPFDLSGGQKRRVAIAGVLAMRPQILILDEPTAGLDPKGRRSILSSIKKLQEKTGITVVLVSHSMEDIADNVKRVVVMNNGEIVMDGSIDEIFSKAALLNEIGLGVPAVTTVMNKLSEMGYNLPSNIYTVKDAVSSIKKLLGKEGLQ